MTSYIKTTDFAAKDALLSGNPAKTVKGVEIDYEFTAIQAADATNLKGIAVSTDNAVVRFDGTAGNLVQGSPLIISDLGVMTGVTLAASSVTNTPAGGISAATVQDAINELDTEKLSITSASSFRNKLINGDMRIDQRNGGNAQTITAGAALAYTVDRWYGYCTGANVTGQRVAGTAPNQYNYRYTGAASVTKIGHAQRIEATNSQDLAGTTATLSVDLANSLLTTVTWTAWYANTADTFGTLASPTRTQIATGTFTVTSTLTRYSTSISIPAGATTGIEVEFSVGAQTSGTWTIGRAQLEAGSVATPFESRPYGTELALCQRYYYRTGSVVSSSVFGAGYCQSTLLAYGVVNFPTTLRIAPSALEQTGTATDYRVRTTGTTVCSSVPTLISATQTASSMIFTVASGLTQGQGGFVEANSTAAYLGFSAEL